MPSAPIAANRTQEDPIAPAVGTPAKNLLDLASHRMLFLYTRLGPTLWLQTGCLPTQESKFATVLFGRSLG